MKIPGRSPRTSPDFSQFSLNGRGLRCLSRRTTQPSPLFWMTRGAAMIAETLDAAASLDALTVLPIESQEAGKGGEGGDFQITNAGFIALVFPRLPEGAFAAVTSKSGDPSE